MSGMVIRSEEPQGVGAVGEVVRRAFAQAAHETAALTAIASSSGACNSIGVNEVPSASRVQNRTAAGRHSVAASLQHSVRANPERPLALEILVGACAALLAVLIRWSLPLGPQQLPTLTVVVAMAIVTTFIGARAGLVTAVVGGLLSWYLFFNAYSWSLANDAWIPLIGFSVIAMVIVSTAALYRGSERRLHAQELVALTEQAANAELFAREMAHRLKNALAIVQSIAFQTFGNDTPEAILFASRLKALADANELLSEQVDEPEANVFQVVNAALQPFDASSTALEIECTDSAIPARQVMALTLALHELATNAVKYGALSVAFGRVSLRIEDAGDLLRLTWKERGGPAVAPPEHQGFGTRLLRRTGTSTQLSFEPDGVRCSFSIRKA
jgi:two-component sensor histidine kinase